MSENHGMKEKKGAIPLLEGRGKEEETLLRLASRDRKGAGTRRQEEKEAHTLLFDNGEKEREGGGEAFVNTLLA